MAEAAGLKRASADRVVEEVREAVLRWADFAQAAGVGEASTTLVAEAIQANTA